MFWNERNRMLKLEIPTVLTDGSYSGQVMFGHEVLRTDGREAVAQKWTALTQGSDMLAVYNKGTYGSSEKDGVIGLTLLRSAGYAGTDVNSKSPTYRELRYHPRMDQGERTFFFRVDAGEAKALTPVLDQRAQSYNEEPYIFMLTPSGNGEKKGRLFTVSSPSVLVSAFKRAENGEGYTLRLYEGAGEVTETTLDIPSLHVHTALTLNPFELRTLHLNEKTGEVTCADILE